MKHNILRVVSFLLFFACNSPEARQPKQQSTNSFYKEILAKNKKLNAREQRFLKRLVEKDTANTYKLSSTGFWYAYVNKTATTDSITVFPKVEDLVVIEYSVLNIDDVVLYPKKKITYKVDKQELIPGLQDGIKLMKKGETIIFVIPSYRAYGVIGDENKIGFNQPIKSKVTLISIN